jgi:choline dehydrogenase-like flavoprotein
MLTENQHIDVVVIGSGFGGTINALTIARHFKNKSSNKKVVLLERGTWWTTPVGTVQDKNIQTPKMLRDKGHPVQFWSSHNGFKGLIDLATRCLKTPKNFDGLFDLTNFKKKKTLFFFGGENDKITILRSNGVGGGSLVYSNITIRPPEIIFDHARWKALPWSEDDRDFYYNLARKAIGTGILRAWDDEEKVDKKAKKANFGLSNIVTRSAGLDPHFVEMVKNRKALDNTIRVQEVNRSISLVRTKHEDSTTPPSETDILRDERDTQNMFWLDRARVFQTSVNGLSTQFGAVDHSINDFNPAPTAAPTFTIAPDAFNGFKYDKTEVNFRPANNLNDREGFPKNYCERQGRCNVGCLPGARHTLNKQLFGAIIGGIKPNGEIDTAAAPYANNLSVEALTEVSTVEALTGGGYRIYLTQHLYVDGQVDYQKSLITSITADKVIMAAGTVGTNEILLRSKQNGHLPELSDTLGEGFSTNGDYLAFIENTKEKTRLTRGPAQTSYAHFNDADAVNNAAETNRFHSLEDLGLPPALASSFGFGNELFNRLVHGEGTFSLIWAVFKYIITYPFKVLGAIFKNAKQRQDFYRDNDEVTANMMLVTATGREDAVGKFTLGGDNETPLRLKRTDGKAFIDDPVYQNIKDSLAALAPKLSDTNTFVSPSDGNKSVALSHPMGGCAIANDVSKGVVNHLGKAYKKSGGFYEGLFVSDGSVFPYSLGVNPSLTISAISLRIAQKGIIPSL